MSIGFTYREALHGRFHWLDAPLVEREAKLSLAVAAESIPRSFQSRRLSISGSLSLEDFVHETPVSGTVGIKIRERRIPYDFSFEHEGRVFRALGEKDLHPSLMGDALGRLPLSLFDDRNYEVARAVLFVPIASGSLSTLVSFRLRWFERKQNEATLGPNREGGPS